MQTKITLAAIALMLAAPLAQAQDYGAKADFCRQQKVGVDRRASEASATLFGELHRCNTFCSRAAAELDAGAEASRLEVLTGRCETSFDALPDDIKARYGAPPDAADMSSAAQMRDMAGECAALGQTYPRLANNRKGASFNNCKTLCEHGATQIEEAGDDLGGFAARCRQEYDAAKSRL